MWCVWFLACVCAALASVVDINDTVFATLPPLYGLDDWSQCQRDGDVYCMVDAALHSPRPSPVMMLLQVCTPVGDSRSNSCSHTC
uniref:Secreted protein n=1 Tax=Heliothis virescens TaxID=7102 RepID=A0A2A4IZV2_HELVI